MVVVLSEASCIDSTSLNGRELHQITETARLFGCRVYPLPSQEAMPNSSADIFAYVPTFEQPQLGIWVGYIPTPERYTTVYTAAQTRNIHLINTPRQFQTAMEFDRFYSLLGDLTPKSQIVTHPDQLEDAAVHLGFPLFLKGPIKSNKDQGWQACVATNHAELETITQTLFHAKTRSRGRVIVRALVKLRTITTDYQAFPLGREYRAFVYHNQVLAIGFYWDEYGDTFPLTPQDTDAIHALAAEAAQRVGTPFIAVDIGQLEGGAWMVIEVGDGQFSGLSHVPVLTLWHHLKDLAYADS